MSTQLTYLLFPKATDGGGWEILFDNLNATGEEYDQNEPEIFTREVLQSISPLGLDARIVDVFGINSKADNYVSSVMAIVDILPEEVVHIPVLEKRFSVRPAKALEDFLGADVAASYLTAPERAFF